MKLRLLGREEGLVRLACDGDVSLWPAVGGLNPLDQLLGPEDYGGAVLLDVSQADHLGSSGISWLIGSHQRCRNAGGRLLVHSPGPRFREVIDLVRLDELLTVVADEGAARALARETGP